MDTADMCGDRIRLPQGMLRWLAVINTVIQVPWNAAIFLTRRATSVNHFSLFFWRYLLSMFRCIRCLRGGRGYCTVLLFSSPKCPDQLRGPLLFKEYGDSFLGVKAAGTSSAEVLNEWSYTSLHHMPLWNVLSVSWNTQVLGLYRIVWRESSNYGDFLVSAGT
jgi:hypothetical protein